MKKSGDQDLLTEVRKLKKDIQRRLRRSYWRHIDKLVTDDTTTGQPSKKFWSHIKNMRTAGMGVSPLKVDGKLVTEARDQAEMLNQQFQSAFSPATTYSPEEFRMKCSLEERDNPSTIEDINITEEGVRKLLRNLNPHKASGPDGISHRVLKELADELAPALTLLYRSIFTPQWNCAN